MASSRNARTGPIPERVLERYLSTPVQLSGTARMRQPCHLWTGRTDRPDVCRQYGQLDWSEDGVKFNIRAHVLAYRIGLWAQGVSPVLAVVPDGMMVCHHCDVKLCHNFDHLYLGTPAENGRDYSHRGSYRLQRAKGWVL